VAALKSFVTKLQSLSGRISNGRLPHELLLGVILFAVALAIRMWGLSFGLPSFFSGDEVGKRDTALHLAETHFVHTGAQPSFVYNSLFLIYSVAKMVNPDWTGVDYHYMGRLWMAALGALTVVFVWRLGSQFDNTDNKAGLVAALLLTILPLHTAVSRYIKEDAPLGLMVTITVLAAVVYLQNPSRAKLLLVGLLAGLTFSTKYTGLVLMAPILLAVMVYAWRTEPGVRASAWDLAVLVPAFWLGFFAFSPIYLFHPEKLVNGFLFQAGYTMLGHDGIVNDPWKEWWTYYVRTGLIPGMTWPVFLLAVAGLGLLMQMRTGWLVGVTALWLYVVLEYARAKPAPFPARYLMPLVPLLCVAAGVSLAKLTAVLKKKLAAPVVYVICGALFIAPPLIKSVLIIEEALNDTRTVAGKWMEANIPSGSRIVITEDLRNLPVSGFWENRWQVEDRNMKPGLDASWTGYPQPYFVVSSFKFQRFLDSPDSVPERTAFYRTVMSEFELIKEFHPRWVTYGKHSPVIRIYRPPGRDPRLSRAVPAPSRRPVSVVSRGEVAG
jgi:hypothetical protein